MAVYGALLVVVCGLVLVARPVRRLGVGTRRRALLLVACGAATAAVALLLPARWRLIHPGSALIRRMWLRAIERRTTRSESDPKARADRTMSSSAFNIRRTA